MHVWRPLLSSDISAVSAIAAEVHRDFPEDDAVFIDRQALAPQTCFLLEIDGVASGYMLAHPFRLGTLPALNAVLGQLPARCDTLYIHDLALEPRARGTGAAREIVEKLIGLAKPFPTMSLVAVNGSVHFWSRFGFVIETRPDLAAKLDSYEKGARFMARRG